MGRTSVAGGASGPAVSLAGQTAGGQCRSGQCARIGRGKCQLYFYRRELHGRGLACGHSHSIRDWHAGSMVDKEGIFYTFGSRDRDLWLGLLRCSDHDEEYLHATCGDPADDVSGDGRLLVDATAAEVASVSAVSAG